MVNGGIRCILSISYLLELIGSTMSHDQDDSSELNNVSLYLISGKLIVNLLCRLLVILKPDPVKYP